MPRPASWIACSATAAMPARSMSFIVKTCTRDSRTRSFSLASRFRTPISTVCSGLTFGEKPPMHGQLRGLGPEQRRQRHPVHVAAGAAGRRVHVAVRVHPDEADRLVRPPRHLGTRRDGPRGEAVIAPEHERQRPGLEAGERRLVQRGADPRDVADVLLALVAGLLRLGNRHLEVALVRHRVAELLNPLVEPGDSQRGRPHVDASPSSAEVERHADDVDGNHAPLSAASRTPTCPRPTAPRSS